MDEVEALIERLLAGNEIESELGRVRAYRKCVRHAETELYNSHLCNVFLLRAAERLGQPPMAVPVVHNRVPLPEDASLCFYYHDEEGPVLVGNPAGLDYLGDLLKELAQSPLPGENLVLEEGYPPFVGDSMGLSLYRESEEWFDAAGEGLEDEFVGAWEAELDGRIMASDELAALQFAGPVASSLALTPRKLYRVHTMGPWRDGAGVVRKPYRSDLDRVRLVELTDDDGHPLQLGVDLDDPDIVYYYDWHLEQLLHGGQSPA